MSIAFSSSLLGLAGSLILGLLDLNLGQAQNKFSQYFEKILNSNSSPDFSKVEDKPTGEAIQKIYDNLENLLNAFKKSSDNQTKISNNLEKFNEILNKINSNSSNLDKQLSNFLSSQLNTQSTLMNLTEALSKNGILEAKKVKEYFQKIEKELKKIKKIIMSTRSLRNRLADTTNIWPGFVDVLATLLIVIIFVLMVFTVSQIYLSDAISGRDKALQDLRTQINELSKITC